MSTKLEVQIYATFQEYIAKRHLTLCQVEDKHFDSAAHLIDMLPEHSLRTLDKMHLATADTKNQDGTIKIDVRLNRLANARANGGVVRQGQALGLGSTDTEVCIGLRKTS